MEMTSTQRSATTLAIAAAAAGAATWFNYARQCAGELGTSNTFYVMGMDNSCLPVEDASTTVLLANAAYFVANAVLGVKVFDSAPEMFEVTKQKIGEITDKVKEISVKVSDVVSNVASSVGSFLFREVEDAYSDDENDEVVIGAHGLPV